MPQATVVDLQTAVERQHGCTARIVGAEHINERFWRGIVYVFQVDRKDATRAYAWSYFDYSSEEHRVASVLGGLTHESPVEALRIAIKAGKHQ